MEFINFRHPSDFRSSALRHNIRRHVTKQQHRKQRERVVRIQWPEENDYRQEPDHETKPDQRKEPSPFKFDAETSSSRSLTPLPNYHASLQSECTSTPEPLSTALSVHRESQSPRISMPAQVPLQAMLPCDSVFNALISFVHTNMLPSHVATLHMEPSQSRIASIWTQDACSSEPALYNVLLLNAIPRFACCHHRARSTSPKHYPPCHPRCTGK